LHSNPESSDGCSVRKAHFFNANFEVAPIGWDYIRNIVLFEYYQNIDLVLDIVYVYLCHSLIYAHLCEELPWKLRKSENW
jgi:hypothetical protein